jgi:dihydrofolate reductase
MLTLIVARGRDGAIGKNNTIPWRLPQDLAFFQRETIGGAIIMGRLTWESLPVRPLKNRINILVSRDKSLAETVFSTPRDAVEFGYQGGCRRVYGIGGQGIYADLLPVADRLVVTEVEITVPGADAFFPEFDPSDWRELGSHRLEGEEPKAVVRELIRRR